MRARPQRSGGARNQSGTPTVYRSPSLHQKEHPSVTFKIGAGQVNPIRPNPNPSKSIQVKRPAKKKEPYGLRLVGGGRSFCVLLRPLAAIHPRPNGARSCLIVLFSVLIRLQQCLLLRLLRILAAIQSKCLSMNNLHTKSGFSKQAQSSPIKVNQGVFLKFRAHYSITPHILVPTFSLQPSAFRLCSATPALRAPFSFCNFHSSFCITLGYAAGA